jgi:alternate F1F0 ATPase F1 subunit epsilon
VNQPIDTRQTSASSALHLLLRTPDGLQYDGPILRLRAEDLDGWFGIGPGRPDLISVLPPGLLVFEDTEGEAFVANGGGTLDLKDGVCRVAVRSAVIARQPESVARALGEQRASMEHHKRVEHETLDVLIKEAMRRTADPALASEGWR